MISRETWLFDPIVVLIKSLHHYWDCRVCSHRSDIAGHFESYKYKTGILPLLYVQTTRMFSTNLV